MLQSHSHWKLLLFSFWTLSEIIPHWCTSVDSSLISLAPAFVHVSNNAKKKERRLRKIQNKNSLWQGACFDLSRHHKIFAYKTLFKFALSSMSCKWDAIPSNCSTFACLSHAKTWPDTTITEAKLAWVQNKNLWLPQEVSDRLVTSLASRPPQQWKDQLSKRYRVHNTGFKTVTSLWKFITGKLPSVIFMSQTWGFL